MHIELDIKKYLMILGDMSVAVRGRPPKGVERRNVVLRIPKDLLERINKPRQNIVYLSAESNRLCWIRVSTDISIRDLSSVGGLIVPLYSVVAHRNATLWVQSI
jgi:hypothetical protein